MSNVRTFGLLVVLFAAPLGVNAQASPKSELIGPANFLGVVAEGAYRNDFFKFRIPLPTDMYLPTETEKSAAKSAGAQLLSSGVAGNRSAWEKSASAEVIILSLTEKELGSSENASLNVGALKQPSGVSAKMVVDTARDFLLKNPGIKIAKDTRATKLSAQDSSVMDLTATINGQTVHFRYYATIRNGYSLTFVITYATTESLERFEKVLSTLIFDTK